MRDLEICVCSELLLFLRAELLAMILPHLNALFFGRFRLSLNLYGFYTLEIVPVPVVS